MPRSYWLPFVAIVGLVLAGSIEGKSITGHSGSNFSATQNNGKPQTNTPPNVSVGVQNDVKRIASALEAANSKPPSMYDRRNAEAQEDVAWWTPWIAVIATMEMLITGAGVFLVYRTLVHTKRAADAAETAVKNLEIPHIFPIDLKYLSRGSIYCDPGEGAQITAKFKNFGRSPAIMRDALLKIIVRVPFDEPPNIDPLVQMHSFDIPAVLGEKEVSSEIGPESIDGIGKFVAQIDEGKLLLLLVVRVSYGDVFENEWTLENVFIWNPRLDRFDPAPKNQQARQREKQPPLAQRTFLSKVRHRLEAFKGVLAA